jgi:hypothetical protein
MIHYSQLKYIPEYIIDACQEDTFSQTEDPDAFKKHLKRCSEIVKKWPEWKQNLLGPIHE